MTVRVDWERIEADYRAGVLSIREIAGQHGITHGAVNKRAKRDGWVRNIAAKAQAKADQLVSRAMVSTQVSTEAAISERILIEATAQVIADVRMRHRGDIGRAMRLSMMLLAELEGQTNSLELLEQLGELMRSEDERGQDKRNDLYNKIIATPGRIDSIKKLSETLKNLVGLERDAYGIGATPPESTSVRDMAEDELERRITELEHKWSATLVG
jgi:hypothetical protein